jgi:hypothetical protein
MDESEGMEAEEREDNGVMLVEGWNGSGFGEKKMERKRRRERFTAEDGDI